MNDTDAFFQLVFFVWVSVGQVGEPNLDPLHVLLEGAQVTSTVFEEDCLLIIKDDLQASEVVLELLLLIEQSHDDPDASLFQPRILDDHECVEQGR